MKRALIIGGGPAGLTAAYELLKGSKAKNAIKKIIGDSRKFLYC